ncbi:MAG: hypothetical protein WA061_06325 [Microgenomates group bacterium]
MKQEDIDKAKQKAMEVLVDRVLELPVKPVTEVIKDVEKKLNDPISEAINAVGELTTKQQLVEVAKKYGKTAAFNALKKLENIGIGVAQLLPILGPVSQELVDAAVLEGATASEAKALATGAKVLDGGKVAYPLSHLIGETGAKKLDKALKALDPYPDLHPGVVAAFGAAGIVIPGVGAIPNGIEIAILNVKDMKNAAGAVKESVSIISKSPEVQQVKDFTSGIIQGITNRINRAAGPQMGQARAAFGVI